MKHISKTFKTLQKQVDLLRDRNLIIEDDEIAKKHLLEKSYFDLINGFETLLLDDTKSSPKNYTDKNFNDFVELYDFDKNLSSLILKTIDELEIKLKTSLSYRFCEVHCANLGSTYNYMDINNYSIPIVTDGPPRLVNYFKSHKLFKTNYRYKKETGLNYAEFCKLKYEYINTYEKPSFWIVVKTLMLNEVLVLMYGLEKTVFDKILLDFGYQPSEKDKFLNSIEIIIELRNHCAHFQLVNRFRTDSRIKINKALINDLNLNCMSKQYKIKLYDILQILGKYSNMDRMKILITKYWEHNSKNNKDYLNEGLFSRMGNNDLEKWKRI